MACSLLLWGAFSTYTVVTVGVSWTLIPLAAAFNFLIWWGKTPGTADVPEGVPSDPNP